jgi:hypothetical protein
MQQSPRPAAEPLVARLLRHWAAVVYAHRRLFFYPHLFLVAGSLYYTVTHLEFSTARNDLVGADKEYHRNFLAYKREFLAQNELVAVVESEDLEKNRQFVERLGARLAAETNLFTDVLFNNDVKMLGNKALLFFPEPDLQQLLRTLREYRPFLKNFTQATNLTSLFRLVNQQFRTAPRERSTQTESLIQALPALERIVQQATDSLERPGTPPAPGLTALFNAGRDAQRQIYITYAGGRLYLATARPRTASLENEAVRRFRELVQQTRLEVPGVNAAITGEPVLEYDEMRQSQRDTARATLLALALVALIFIYSYRESGRPVKATICLMVGVAYTLAFATLAIGHLNILTITFVPMLIGLGIDFGVHLITRYEEELRQGKTEREAIEKAMVNTGQGIFTGCFTTAGAFLAMALTDFKGIREMGIICGGGLLLCLVPMLTLLPVLLLRGRQNLLDHNLPRILERRARIERLWLERPVLVLGLTLLFCGVSLGRARRVHFDYNLLHLQTKGLPAVLAEQKLIHSAEKSVLYCAVITRSLEEALATEARLTNLPAVATVDSMARFLTEDQSRKLPIVSAIKAELAPLRWAPPDAKPVDLRELSRTLYYLQGYLGLAAEETAKAGDEDLRKQLLGLREALTQLRRLMLAGDPDQASAKLAAFQRALFDDLQTTFDALRYQDDRERLRAENLPPALRNRFVSRSGDLHLLQVYPKKDLWERENQVEFIGQLRACLDTGRPGAPVITGTPVQLMEYTQLLRASYEQAAGYALAAIALLTLLHFRSLTCVVLALLPVVIGSWWMIGFMGWCRIPFNPANIMTLPLVIGIGVTSGIHILNRFAEERSPSILAKSTGKAVLISALTTIVGFGSLMLAQHQGIASLGYVMSVGTATCMVAALTFLPALLNLLVRHGWGPVQKTSDATRAPALAPEEPGS